MPFLPSLTKRSIKRFKINTSNLISFFSSVESMPLGENWPVVYLLHNDNYQTATGSHQKLLYIGESTSASRRMKEHFSPSNKNFGDRIKLNEADIIFDETFNKSAILDIEQELIRMFGADSSNYTLQNRNDGQSMQHQYFERDLYYISLKEIWNELRLPAVSIAKDKFEDVRNSNLFKYSPYTALTTEQVKVCDEILDKSIDSLGKKTKFNAVIEGCAGTGKTVVLIKVLSELIRLSKIPVASSSTATTIPTAFANVLDDDSSDSVIFDFERKEKDNARAARIQAACPNGLRVAYVVPLGELLKPFKTVIKAVCGDPDIVKTASEVANDNDKFDVIFVDEAHRLGTINKFGNNKESYKNACSKLSIAYTKGMKNPPTELDWLVAKTDNLVFVYDKNQKVRSHPSITNRVFDDIVSSKSYSHTYTLKMQMRCKAGSQYVEFLEALFNNAITSSTPLPPWKGYDLRIYDDVEQMISDINAFNASGRCGLSRVVAGYGWEWMTNKDKITRRKKKRSRQEIKSMSKTDWDIHINGYDYFWNVENGNFIFNADRDEIGCVHTVQGFDLNYVGVIFGPEIKYNPTSGFEINEDSIYDSGVKTRNKSELLELTIRAYKVMMERGIRGCFVYAVDPVLQQYLKQHLPSVAEAQAQGDIKIIELINKLTGLSVVSGGRTIKDVISIRKEDLDDLVDKEDRLTSIITIEVDGEKIYRVHKVTLSADGEYYVFSVSENQPFE